MPAFKGPDGRVVYVPEAEANRYRTGEEYQEVSNDTAGDIQNRIDPTHTGVLGSIGATISAGLSGATLGGSDWLLKGVLDKGQFEQLAQDRADNPILAGTAQAAGMMLPALVSGGAVTPAGALGKLAGEGIAAGRATGGALGVAQQLGAAGAEGAIANAGIYLSDVALGDRKLTAEGVNGALGTGLLFGAAGIPVSHGIEAGTMAARRMFARYAEGGAQAASDATAAWTEKAQRHMEAFDQAADAAKAKLAEAQTAREAANLERLRANAQMADAHAYRPAAEFPGGPGAGAVPEAAARSSAGAGEAASSAPAAGRPLATYDDPKVLRALNLLQEQSHLVTQEQIDAWNAVHGAELQQAMGEAIASRAAAGDVAAKEQLAGLEARIGNRTYSSGGSAPQPAAVEAAGAPNALELLGQQPGVVTHGPATSVREFGARAVPGSAEADLGAKLTEYQDARQAFHDLHAQVDPDLDAILRGVQPDDLQKLAVPIGEFRTPIAKGTPAGQRAVGEAATGHITVSRTPVRPGEAPAPSLDLTSQFKLEDTPLRFDAERRQYFNMDVPAEPMGGRSLGEVAAEQAPVPVEQPATAVAKRPARAAAPDTSAIPDRDAIKAHEARADAPLEATVSAREIAERGYYEPPVRGGGSLEEADPVRMDKARKAIAEGQREAIDLNITPSGKITVEGGRHRLQAAIEADAPIRVKWSSGAEPAEDQVLRHGARAAAQPAEGDLLAALSGTKAAVDKGENLVEMGAPARDAYRAAKAERTSAAAEHFRGKALEGRAARAEAVAAGETPNPFHEPTVAAHGGDLDQFFADLRAPKTRDAYVAANIGRAMREEGSHAAALAKVEREWADRAATEAWAERAAVLEYEGGYSRAEAERLAREEMGNAARGPGSEPPPAWESKKNLKRTEAAKKAAAASVERLHEIHSAVASNLPQELQTAWNEEGYKFLREESARIRGVKDRINAASKISEAFTEKYGAASETGRGYEGDRFHRRAEIEARHAESWANEQERKYYAAAAREGHPLDVKRLEMAHDAAIERAATATEPAERAAAAQEAKAIERQMTQVGARPGAVEDIAAIAPAVTRIEKAAAELTEALGDAAPAAAKEHAAAFRAAEDEADRKMAARIGHAADDAATTRGAAQSGATPPPAAADDLLLGPSQKQQRIAAAQKAQREAGAAYTKARVAEAEAQIGAKQAAGAAAEARAKLGPPPEAPGGAPGGHGIAGRVMHGAHMVGFAADLAADVGIPGIPRPHDIPVIGPLLSAYLKYRALRAAAGRFVGRVPVTGETRAAELAARTRDGIARAVDRSLGLLERNTNTVRTALTVGSLVATDALSKRLIDDGHPDAPAKASVSEQAAVRMREVAAVVANPSLVQAAIRVQGRALTDPDLIDALSAHLLGMFQHLSEVMPKGPPPNPYTGKAWTPPPGDAIRFGQQVAIARDPKVAFQMLEAGTLTKAGAETLQKCYELLFRDGQARVVQRAADLKNPVDYSQLLRLGRLFDVPLHPSQDPQHAAALAAAHTPAAKPEPSGPGPGGPPTPSIANPTSISNLYDAGGARRAGR